MQVILHIGPPKTGSTAIQSALFQTRDALAEQGICVFLGYKNAARSLSTLYDRPGRSLIPPGMRIHFTTPKEAKAWSEKNWQMLEAHLAETKPAVTLLSSEHFADLTKFDKFIERLRRSFDKISAIYYLREPASLYCSMIDQSIRGGKRLAQLTDPWSYEYPGLGQIQRYLDALGRDNVVVRSFQRDHLHKNDIRQDYFHVLRTHFGLDLDVEIGTQPQNESLCGAASAWMLTLNESFERMPSKSDRHILELRRVLIKRLREAEILKGLPKLSLIDHPGRDVIRQNARGPLEWCNANLLGADIQQTLPDPASDMPARPENPQAVMADWIFSYLDAETARQVAHAATLYPAAAE